ncbi:uncharacterized protein LOC129722460 [Wyeomyia smithii]|uniref:uncharacterized protein LOC129722460 n=1 Tax=Wyeomyia smithii TaxID=174621 RepID=UPI002467DCE3|nr:uncharacterized protein LOC129722460 [Wyeomyia smithii]
MVNQLEKFLRVLLVLAGFAGLGLAQNLEAQAQCAQVSYALFEDQNDCGQFVFCQGGTAENLDCLTDEIWSQSRTACVLGNRDTCEPWDPWEACDGRPNGPTVYPRNCMQYISCIGLQAEVIECLPGFVYVENGTSCEVGNALSCESLTSLCAVVGTSDLFSHPIFCNAYIGCNGTEPVLEYCSANQIFETNIQFCVPGNVGTCTVTPVDAICDLMTNGIFPHPEECTKFVQCSGSITTIVDCQQGEIFNPRISGCAAGDTENCLLLDTLCNGQRDGVLLSHPNYCSSFIRCSGNAASLQNCPLGRIFRSDMQFCVPGNQETCEFTPLEAMCENIQFGTIFPHPEDCTQYVRCQNGQSVSVSCPDHTIVEPGTIVCVPGDQESCLVLDSFCEGIDVGKVEVPNHCTAYVLCDRGVATFVECLPGEIFSAAEQACIPGNTLECERLGCAEQENSISIHPNQCNKFTICNNGQISLHPCRVGDIFNPTWLVCTAGDPTTCEFRPVEQMCVGHYDNTRLPYPSGNDCRQFVVCTNEQASVVTCPEETVLQPQTLYCFPGNMDTCELLNINCDPNQEETIRHPTRCDMKINCVAGFPVIEQCPEGEIVNDDLECAPGDVMGCFCIGRADGLYKHPGDCSQYMRCSGEEVERISCPEGEIFREDMLMCVPGDSNSCEPAQVGDMCGGRPDGQRYPHPDECDQFVVCTDELPTVSACDRGNVIQPGTGNCAAGNAGTCELYDNLCVEENIGHPEYCDLFIDCQLEVGVAKSCSRGEIWDHDSSRCLPGTVEPCGVLTLCSEAENGVRLPHPEFCDIYIECVESEDTIVACPVDQIFDSTTGECVPGDSETCEVQPEVNICTDIVDGTLLPNPESCEAYFRCEQGEPVSLACLPGHIFEGNECVPGSSFGCENFIEQCVGEIGRILPFPDGVQCRLFLACSNGVTSVGNCPEGQILVDDGQLCTAGEEASCEVNEENIDFCSGLDDGLYEHPLLCYLYVECTGGVSQVSTCAGNEIFSPDDSECREGDRVNCSVSGGDSKH